MQFCGTEHGMQLISHSPVPLATRPGASVGVVRSFWETFGAVLVALPLIGALGTIAATASSEVCASSRQLLRLSNSHEA